MDNGPEFSGRALVHMGFNGKFRDEWLNEHWVCQRRRSPDADRGVACRLQHRAAAYVPLQAKLRSSLLVPREGRSPTDVASR